MICLDASVVGMLISPDENSDEVLDRYEQARLKREVFIAPHLLPFEIASVLRKKQLRRLLSGPEVMGAMHFFQGLKIQLVDFDGLIQKCLSLAETFGKNLTVYDASYLAVAEKKQAVLWTADRGFYNTVVSSYSELELVIP